MNESTIPVLDYSSIRPDKKTESSLTPAFISLGVAVVPFLILALGCYPLAIIAFLFLPFLGVAFGAGGIKAAHKHPVAIVAGTIGTTINGLMAACVVYGIYEILCHGLC